MLISSHFFSECSIASVLKLAKFENQLTVFNAILHVNYKVDYKLFLYLIKLILQPEFEPIKIIVHNTIFYSTYNLYYYCIQHT